MFMAGLSLGSAHVHDIDAFNLYLAMFFFDVRPGVLFLGLPLWLQLRRVLHRLKQSI
jgi:hypothetical protein